MTNAGWHVSREGRQYGPCAWEDLLNLARKGQLRPGDLLWTSGLEAWIRADQVPGLPWAAPVPPLPPTAEPPAAPPATPDGPRRSALSGLLGARSFLWIASLGIVLLLVGAGGYLLWRLQPWRSQTILAPAASRRPLAEYRDERFDSRPVVPPDAVPESSGLVEIRPGGTDSAALSDGTRVSFPGLAEGESVRVTLERAPNNLTLTLNGIQTTGSMRVLTLGSVHSSGGTRASGRLVPRIVIPPREIGRLEPETILLARQGLRVVDGEGVRDRLDFLPVVRDLEGNLVAADIWLPSSPVVQGGPLGTAQSAPERSFPAANSPAPAGRGRLPLSAAWFSPLFAAGPAAQPARNVIRYVAVTYQQNINWDRKPQLIRMAPDPIDPARRRPLFHLSTEEQAQELAKPVQNVFILVHGRNEMEKAGVDTPPQIKAPWWYAYKQDVWTNFYGVFQADHKEMLGSTIFYEFIYPSFRPIFQGNGPTAEFFHEAIREQLKRQLNLNQSFNLFIVAHSMGGVVSRAGLQYFDGRLADSFRHLATWGTPHLGSPLVSLNYALVSPYHILELTGPDLSSDWRRSLLKSVLITDNPGTQDLRWTNGNAGYVSELRFDRMGFVYDLEAIKRHFKSAAAARPVVNLRSGSYLYSDNLRLLNANDKYAGTDKYIFLYGVTAKGVELEWTGGVFDKGFELEAISRQSKIGRGATTLWLLVENPTTKYLEVPQGRGDGAVPILSMAGHGIAEKPVFLGECDHEEYFGAPDSPGNFQLKGKASHTAKATLSNLGIGSVERYNPPEIRINLRRERDVKDLLEGDLEGDLEIDGELIWPGDRSPDKRIKPDKIEASVTQRWGKSREPVEARDFTLQGGGRFRAGLSIKDLKRAGLDRKTDLQLYVRLFFKDETELESEPLPLTGQEALRGSFLGTIRVTSVNRDYILNRFIKPGSDEMTRLGNESTRDLNRLYLQNIEWAGLNQENGLTLSIFSVAENSGEADQLEGKQFIDLIFRGPRLIPNDFRPYQDKRNGEVMLTLTATTFEVIKKQSKGLTGNEATLIYKVRGTLRDDTLSGGWSVMENGTEVFAGVYTAKRMEGVQ